MMSQFNAPIARKSGGSLDVYSVLLFVAFLVLTVGIFFVATENMKSTADGMGTGGSPFQLIAE